MGMKGFKINALAPFVSQECSVYFLIVLYCMRFGGTVFIIFVSCGNVKEEIYVCFLLVHTAST